MPPNPKALLAGLMGLFGGLPQKEAEDERPTMDDVWKQATKKEKKKERNIGHPANKKRRLRKHKWAIEKASRKKNLLRNGTRG